MSDTPRMESALMDAPEVGFTNVWKVGCDIERELNTASQRIKRLEEAGDKLHWAWKNPFDPAGETIVHNWLKAKEAK